MKAARVERKPNANCEVLGLDNGVLQRQAWPRLLTGRADKIEAPDAQVLLNLWRNDVSCGYGYQSVVGTLAITLQLLDRADEPQQALELAIKTWESRNRSRL